MIQKVEVKNNGAFIRQNENSYLRQLVCRFTQHKAGARKSAGVISHPFFQLINFTKAKIWRERTPADFLFALSYMGTREAQKVDREAIMCLPRDYRLWTYTYIHTYIKSSF